jgi:hypothetical protein
MAMLHLLVLLVVCFGCSSWASEAPPNTLLVVGNGTAPPLLFYKLLLLFYDVASCPAP